MMRWKNFVLDFLDFWVLSMLRQKRFQLSNYEVKCSFGIKIDGKPQVQLGTHQPGSFMLVYFFASLELF